MHTFPVVKHFDLPEDRALCFLASSEVTMPDQLIFKAAKEALGRRIIMAVALTTHNRDHLMSCQELSVAGSAVEMPVMLPVNHAIAD